MPWPIRRHHHIDRLHIPLLPCQHRGESPFWSRAVRLVTRRPALTAVGTTAVLVALALPVLTLQTGSAGLTSLPDDRVARQGYIALATYFPSGTRNDPAVAVVDADASSAEVREAVRQLRSLVAGDSSIGESTVSTAPGGDLTVVAVDAVAHGVGATGRIITGAALIIVVVFLGFATGDTVGFQQMGVGVALLIDATVIRTVLLPSTMVLLGRWNWYLPSWLEWLPDLHVEGSAESDAEHQLAGSHSTDRDSV